MIAPQPWLAPLGALYGSVGRARAALYRRGLLPRARLGGPVISVGSLSVGGSGKTPAVAMVAAMLHRHGLPVAVLSRGYGGSFAGDALVVSDGESVLAGAVEAGDEPVMLARDLPGVVVAVGPRRDRVGHAIEARFGRRVHVLDDGFQHLRLHRDLDLLCVTAADLEDQPLPAGRLRESVAAAARADAILLEADGESRVIASWPSDRVFRLRRRVLGFFGRDGRPVPPPEGPLLLAGIARPDRFRKDAAHLLYSLAGEWIFPDHHRYSAADLAEIESRAREVRADAILTTAKDAERLPPEWQPLPVVVLRICAEVEDPERLRRMMLPVAEAAR